MEKLTQRKIQERIAGMDPVEALNYLEQLKNETSINLEKIITTISKQKSALLAERERFRLMSIYEADSYNSGFRFIAGVDEAGRGPLAGPVVAAACILPPDVFIQGLNDSKKLSAKMRDKLFEEIIEKSVSYSLGIVDEKEIDEINILNATKKAMKLAVDGLTTLPDIVLVDAEKIENIPQKQIAIIKGDAKSVSIAAASILAKVTRDRMMNEFSEKYPLYSFAKHKGYGTAEHIEAIKKNGICPIHRVSFTKNFMPESR